MLASTRACGNSICTGIKVNFNWAETINYFICIKKLMSNDIIECININKVLISINKITKRV